MDGLALTLHSCRRQSCHLYAVHMVTLCFPDATLPPQVRERIELSGRDARWEFPKGPLFGRTNYMAEICGALAEMVEVVDDFFKFLGPELKAVTGWEGRVCLDGRPESPWQCGS